MQSNLNRKDSRSPEFRLFSQCTHATYYVVHKQYKSFVVVPHVTFQNALLVVSTKGLAVTLRIILLRSNQSIVPFHMFLELVMFLAIAILYVVHMTVSAESDGHLGQRQQSLNQNVAGGSKALPTGTYSQPRWGWQQGPCICSDGLPCMLEF